MNARDRADELEAIVRQIINVGDIDARHGNKDVRLARNVIAYQMRIDGFTVKDIAEALGRNHSTVVTLTNNFREILNSGEERLYYGYGDDVAVWKKFSELVAKADATKEEPIRAKKVALSLGEFRKMTENLPDDTMLKIFDEDQPGIHICPCYNGAVLRLSRK